MGHDFASLASSTTSPYIPGHIVPHVALPLMVFPISRLPLQSARVHFARPSRPRPASIICACPHMPVSLAPHLTSPPPARAAGHRTAPRALPCSPLRFAPATASRTPLRLQLQVVLHVPCVSAISNSAPLQPPLLGLGRRDCTPSLERRLRHLLTLRSSPSHPAGVPPCTS